MFKFPLQSHEVLDYMTTSCTLDEVDRVLSSLVKDDRVYQFDDYFLISNNKDWIGRRIEGGIRADKDIQKARVISRILMAFPFVRMVSISGSLSKGYADKKSDIDFFIVTSNNQLWTCRTMLHLLKKMTFLFNLQDNFCMNYFIAEEHLEIEERNYFTAIELSTLIPVSGVSYYNKLLQSNQWLFDYLPNKKIRSVSSKPYKPSVIKRGIESLLSSSSLNQLLMNLTDSKWRKKWQKRGYPIADYELAFKSNLYVSKNHPANNQKVILENYHSSSDYV
jgi:predicted nucleotidyltransferase